jgi:hypothetical protein
VLEEDAPQSARRRVVAPVRLSVSLFLSRHG